LACKIYRIVTGSLINQDLHTDNFLKNNVVAIGRVAGEYFFDKKYNRDSKWDPKEGLGLPHRRKVVWRRKPSFSRKKLPDDLSSQLKQRGTLKQIYYPINKFEKEIRKIS